MRGQAGLSTALAAAHLPQHEITELIGSVRKQLNLRRLLPSQTFEIRLDPATSELQSFVYHVSPIKAVEVTRHRGQLTAVQIDEPLDTRLERVGGKIRSSLDDALKHAGEQKALINQFVALFNWDINWYADPREGDQFRIVVEKQYLRGKFYRYGRIQAAEYRGNAGTFQAYYDKDSHHGEGYFDGEGRSVRRDLLRTPLNFRRISSRFNRKRFHPILHRTKGHFGVDYAAAKGTPVWAAADGVVAAMSRGGGSGNAITLRHRNGVSSTYMHLSRFMRGLKKGARVKQGDVIGYVGMTGLATGPHLHYALKVSGKYVDPLKFQAAKGTFLSARARKRFLAKLPPRKRQLEGVPLS